MAVRPGRADEKGVITVLSADIVGSTGHIAACDPDEVATFFDRCFEQLRRAIEAAGGLLVSFEGDGGIAAFGWPGGLEDHADRACAAAWAIQHDIDLLGPGGAPVGYRVGVHSGLVALRHIRRRGRSRFNTVGAAVNIAAKLQQSAPPGAVVVSAETVGLCRNRLDLAAHEAPSIDGAPVTSAWRLTSRPSQVRYSEVAHRYPDQIIGRRAELQRLLARLPRAGAPGGAIAVIGEAGIGKSRLAAAAAAEAERAGVRVLIYYGDAMKRAAPFAPARALIAALLSLTDAAPRQRVSEALTPLDLAVDDAAAVAGLFAGRRSSQPSQGALTRTQVARALANAVLALTGGQATLLLIEDVHLVDPDSRLFLQLLAQAGPGLAVFLTGRPEAAADAAEVAGEVIWLEPLARPEMLELARRIWPAELAGDLIEGAVDRADGVPFVLEELARSAEAGEAAFKALPRRVESVIHARLRRLPRRVHAVAQALSLLGEEVDVDLLRSVTRIPTDALLTDLADLERFALVHPIGGGALRFRHQIIAEACAGTIPRRLSAELHKAAITAILARTPTGSGRYAQLALHAEGAGDDRRALGYLWDAAVEARGSAATASLNLIFDRALAVTERIGADAEKRYVDFVLMAFPSMLLLGEFDKMRAHLPRAMALARGHGRPDKVSNAQSERGMLCWFDGRYDEGIEATKDGLEIARALGAPALVYANQVMLANLLQGCGRIEEALAELASLRGALADVPEAERWGSPANPRSSALGFTAWIMVETGRYEEAKTFADSALDVALRHRDVYAEIMARNALGRCLLLMDRDAEAAACLATARELADTNGYDAPQANLTGHEAAALARIGRASEAVVIAETCFARRMHLRTGQMEVFLLTAGLAEALVRSGDADRGLAVLEEALAIARRVGNPCLLAAGLSLRAVLLDQYARDAARIGADRAEAAALAARHGLAVWGLAHEPSRQLRPA